MFEDGCEGTRCHTYLKCLPLHLAYLMGDKIQPTIRTLGSKDRGSSMEKGYRPYIEDFIGPCEAVRKRYQR
jgi:hypothetical protein